VSQLLERNFMICWRNRRITRNSLSIHLRKLFQVKKEERTLISGFGIPFYCVELIISFVTGLFFRRGHKGDHQNEARKTQ